MNKAFPVAYIEAKRAERIKKRCVQHESLVTEISNNLTSQSEIYDEVFWLNKIMALNIEIAVIVEILTASEKQKKSGETKCKGI